MKIIFLDILHSVYWCRIDSLVSDLFQLLHLLWQKLVSYNRISKAGTISSTLEPDKEEDNKPDFSSPSWSKVPELYYPVEMEENSYFGANLQSKSIRGKKSHRKHICWNLWVLYRARLRPKHFKNEWNLVRGAWNKICVISINSKRQSCCNVCCTTCCRKNNRRNRTSRIK